MTVNYEKCRTVEEELEYIEYQFECIGNFFVCDVHPNRIKAYHTTFRRLWDKKRALLATEEYQYYYKSNYPDSNVCWIPDDILDKVDPYKE